MTRSRRLSRRRFSRYFGRSLANVDVSALLHQVFDMVLRSSSAAPQQVPSPRQGPADPRGRCGGLYPDLNIFRWPRATTGELKRRRLDPKNVSDL